jgi:cell shape-determining protein MreC
MDIQHVFYWFATIAMVMSILFLLGMVILLFYIKNKVNDLHNYVKYVVHKADHIVEGVSNQVKAITNLRSTLLGKTSK